jgi:flagellar basal body rod protein FlgC
MTDESLPRATPIVIDKDEPYPTGAPPDFAAVVLRVHPMQALTEAEHWEPQSVENLAAGGVIPGAMAYEPPEPEVDEFGYVETPRGRKKVR